MWVPLKSKKFLFNVLLIFTSKHTLRVFIPPNRNRCFPCYTSSQHLSALPSLSHCDIMFFSKSLPCSLSKRNLLFFLFLWIRVSILFFFLCVNLYSFLLIFLVWSTMKLETSLNTSFCFLVFYSLSEFFLQDTASFLNRYSEI